MEWCVDQFGQCVVNVGFCCWHKTSSYRKSEAKWATLQSLVHLAIELEVHQSRGCKHCTSFLCKLLIWRQTNSANHFGSGTRCALGASATDWKMNYSACSNQHPIVLVRGSNSFANIGCKLQHKAFVCCGYEQLRPLHKSMQVLVIDVVLNNYQDAHLIVFAFRRSVSSI